MITRGERFRGQLWWLTHPRWRREPWLTVANHLPRPLVYWCAIRLMGKATSGVHGNEHPDSVTIMQALERWDA